MALRKAHPGTAPRVAPTLLAAADAVLVALTLQALLVLGTLAGGVLAGIAPALVAGATVARSHVRGEGRPVWATFWAAWRREFVPANLAGLPLAALAAMAATNVLVVRQPVWVALSVVGAVLVLAAIGWFGPLVAHYAMPRSRYVLTAFRLSLRRPLPTLLMLLTATGLAWASLWSDAVWVFVGPGAWLLACTHLAVRTFDDNEERLVDGPDAASIADILPTQPLHTR